MSVEICTKAHIDVCVDGVLEAVGARNSAGDFAIETPPTELGRRMMEWNVKAYEIRYGDLPDRAVVKEFIESYEHQRNEDVAELWRPRRLATYRTALSALDYHCLENDAWDETDIGRLLSEAKDSLARKIDFNLACEGSWLWPGADRGTLPQTAPNGDPVRMWSPPLEVVVVAAHDGGTAREPCVFFDGEEVNAHVFSVDGGAGWTWREWCVHRDDALMNASSEAVRLMLEEAFADPPGAKYITGRGEAHWLDDAPPPPPALALVPTTEEGGDATAATS